MHQNNRLTRLDELIANLGGTDTGTHSKGPHGLLMEHLQSARRNLLGATGGEYDLSLEQARDSVTCIADKNVRTKTKAALQSLIDSNSQTRGSVAAV